jgi:hypothetical protein
VNKLKLFCTAGLCAMASIATAADFDGSKPLLCAAATLSECIPGGVCEKESIFWTRSNRTNGRPAEGICFSSRCSVDEAAFLAGQATEVGPI